MALVSPGVEVTIIDQSQYLPAASNSVPLIILATAQNKADASGNSIAAATTAANANKMYQVTSQRDLVNLYGTPFFYKTANGTPIQGYELNEYGLLATYSLLGATNRAYVLRADIDLGQLVGTLSRPVGEPADGTYWLDTTNSAWGIYEFNAGSGKFINKIPYVITDASNISGGYPLDSIGPIGTYAVIPNEITGGAYGTATFFYKNAGNTWVALGSSAWKGSVPTVTGTVANPSLTADDTFTINLHEDFTSTITVESGDQVADIANKINNLGITTISASVNSGRLSIFISKPTLNRKVTLSEGVGTPLADMGIDTGEHYAPDVVFGGSASMPLWTQSQAFPHPTGSVWIKTSVAGSGMNLVLSKYNSTQAVYNSVSVSLYPTVTDAISTLDSTGGQAIAANTVIATTGDQTIGTSGLMFYRKTTSGVTRIPGTVTDVSLGGVPRALYVKATVPGSSSYTSTYTIYASGDAYDFVTAFNAAAIPNVSAAVGTTGVIVLTHTRGGNIILSDLEDGQSNALLTDLGLSYATVGVRSDPIPYQSVAAATGGAGTNAQIAVENDGYFYGYSIYDGGQNYEVGDVITLDGADLAGVSGGNDLVLTVQSVTGGVITSVSYLAGTPRVNYPTMVGNWEELTYTANEGAPSTLPANGTDWFYSTSTQVDIMVNKDGVWKGYQNVAFDSTGHPAASGATGQTDPLGPILATSAPSTQTDGSPLVPGDLWLDTNDLENYPMLSRWQVVDSVGQWVTIDNTDQTSPNGVLFADARWGTSGSVDPVNDPLSSIVSLLTSNYLDLDAPEATNYPQGMLLFNTRRSGYNVKRFTTNYFTQANYPDSSLPSVSYTWVTASGLKSNGAAYMGRKAQRNMVVQALKAAISTNINIREEDTYFNLISCPGYPELQAEMVTLNNDRNNTAYIVGDTPLRLPDQATDISNWATNAAGATGTGEDGWVTRDQYLGVFYPSGITTDLTGASVVVPSSHMMLRTILRNDTIAYPWLAPAGTRRGNIDNATNIGYLDSTTGEFVTIKNRMSIRDVLYTNQINPLAYFTGVGLLNYGNKNSYDSQSAMDRINVARLVAYIRERLQVVARPFVFEPNDALTRSQLQGVVQTLFVDLVAKRGLYDYLVVCDDSNNTPARIDRNELWVDVAIEPVKAAEFIYIPVRIMNTGEIANLK